MRQFLSASSIVGVALISLLGAGLPVAANVDEPNSLDLEQLIQMALKNNAKLAELRGDIRVAVAKERSAKDWDDPEVRVSLRKDHDVELPQAEYETRTTTSRQSGKSNESKEEQRNDNNGKEVQSESTNSKSKEKFDQVTTTRTTRTTRHGARSETVTEKTWESSSESTAGTERSDIVKTKDGKDDGNIGRNESANSDKNETLVDRTVESRQFGSDITTPDEDASVKLRLRVPNPFERKANIARARARIGLATAVLNSAEHELALAVRKSYADAIVANEKLRSARALSEVYSRLAAEITEMGTWAKLEDEIAAQSDAFRSSLELPILELELERELTQIATLVGLSNPRRIALDSQIAPIRVDLTDLDKDFLYQIAEGYRADILTLIHELKVSDYEMDAYNAKKIPWFTFVEGFYGVEHDRGYRSSDNYGIEFGMTLPIFTWFKNKEHEIIEQEQQNLNTQAAAVRKNIRAEVDSAVAQLGRASALMKRFEEKRRKFVSAMNDSLSKAQQGGVQSNDARFRAEESLARLDELKPNLLKSYNEAILMLEHSVGTALDKVFSGEATANSHVPTGAMIGAGNIPNTHADTPRASVTTAQQDRRRPRSRPPHRR